MFELPSKSQDDLDLLRFRLTSRCTFAAGFRAGLAGRVAVLLADLGTLATNLRTSRSHGRAEVSPVQGRTGEADLTASFAQLRAFGPIRLAFLGTLGARYRARPALYRAIVFRLIFAGENGFGRERNARGSRRGSQYFTTIHGNSPGIKA
jgi:hypothetical protein